MPWWILILAVPFTRLWWDSKSANRYREDKKGGATAPVAESNEIKRAQTANIITIVVLSILTILGTSAAYQVDTDIKEEVSRLSGILEPPQKETLSDTVQLQKSELKTHLNNYLSLKLSSATKHDIEKLERCTKQWFEQRSDPKIAVDENCFLVDIE